MTSEKYIKVYRRAMTCIRAKFVFEMELYYDNRNMDFWGDRNSDVALAIGLDARTLGGSDAMTQLSMPLTLSPGR